MHAGKIRKRLRYHYFPLRPLLLLLLRRDMHFYFLVEVLLMLLIIFLVGCDTAAAGARAAYNVSTEAESEVPATAFCFRVSVLYAAMLRTSIAAVVIGCFYFRPLDCDIAFMVVDCAAVDTGCMLE